MRIALCWTASVWKSTLLKAIKTDLPKIQEIWRDLIKIHWKNPHEMNEEERKKFQKDYHELQKIAENLAKQKSRWFISDRSAVDIIAYDLDIEYENYWKVVTVTWRYDIICYIPIEFPLESDWVRNPDMRYQKTIDKRIQRLLQRLDIYDKNCKQFVIKGTLEERILQLEKIISEKI